MMPIRAAELRDLTPFAVLPRNERAAIAYAATTRTFRSGETIFRKDDPCSDLVVVRDGFGRVYRVLADNREITTGIVPPGALLNVTALQACIHHEAYAEALGPVRTIDIPSTIISSVSGRCPAFANSLLHCLRLRAAGIYADAVVNALLPLDERLLHLLRSLARDPSTWHENDEMRSLALRISHERLARLIHSDRSSVTRSLAALEQEGQIRRGHGHITHVRATPVKTMAGE